jgi:hypothetical protein
MTEFDTTRVPEGKELSEETWLERQLIEYLDADSDRERIRLMDGPIEAMVNHEIAEGVDFFESTSREFNRKKVKSYRGMLVDNECLLAHQTTRGNARKILQNGFIEPFSRVGIRDDKIFFWVHFRDMGEYREGNNTFVISKVDIESVLISSYKNFGFLDRELITEKEYNENHVFKLREYARHLKQGHNPDEYYTLDSMLGAIIDGRETW